MPETLEEIGQYARGFLMFLLGTTLFSDRGNTVGLYLLSALVDLSQVSQYYCGGAGLATLYCYMSATSRGRGNIVGGYWRAWELWVYTYFPMLAPELKLEVPLVIPYSHIFEGRYRPRARETLPYLRQFFDTVWATEPPREYMDRMLGVVASLEGMVLQREAQLFIAGVSMPPLPTGSPRPSRGAGRGGSTRSHGRRRAPIRDDEESSEKEESAHPQLETSAGREDDFGSDSEGGGDDEEGSEDGSSDSDDGAGGGGAGISQPKRTKRASYS